MTEDASFLDVAFSDRPLRLAAETAEDLDVISTLAQDAVGQVGDIAWMPRRRRLVLLVNRFRWEDHDAAARQRRAFERVRTALVFDSVLGVRSNGLDPADRETVFSILRIGFEPAEEPGGRVVIDVAGDGALAVSVECLDARLVDLSRPWSARGAPDHQLD